MLYYMLYYRLIRRWERKFLGLCFRAWKDHVVAESGLGQQPARGSYKHKDLNSSNNHVTEEMGAPNRCPAQHLDSSLCGPAWTPRVDGPA